MPTIVENKCDPFDVNLLSDEQQDILFEFKKRFEDLDETFPELSDNGYLQYWLRARKFDIDGAEKMLSNHLQYRQSMDFSPPSTHLHPIMNRFYPKGQFGFDRQGRPIFHYPFGTIDAKGIVHSMRISEAMRSILCYQLDQVLACRNASKQFGKPVRQIIQILDLEGISTKHMWKPGIDVFQQIAHSLEQHVPELVHKIFVINAPIIFNAIFRLIKPILDENTKNKINIFGKDGWQEKFLEYISPDQLPVQYGGICVSPEGHPSCSHIINYGTEVPKELYFTPEDKDRLLPEGTLLSEISIGRGRQMLLEYNVKETRSVLFWYMESSSSHDIGFGIYRMPDNNNSISCKEPKDLCKMEMVYPYFRLLTHIVPEWGHIIINKPGKYVIQLDNSYSWLCSKQVKCYITVEHPKSPLLPHLPLSQSYKALTLSPAASCPVL